MNKMIILGSNYGLSPSMSYNLEAGGNKDLRKHSWGLVPQISIDPSQVDGNAVSCNFI